jgi:hypothetical protein
LPETYLHRCCELFGQTVETLHGWRPDYAGLEKALEPVRLRKREFSYRDIETIQNGRYWDFRQFWRFPGESDLEREVDFAEMSRLIQRLPLDEAQAIGRLHAAFKYIENVSVVLRFVNPAQYGILSPPLEKLLEVRRGRNEVETYLSYLRDLRDARDHYGLPRAADADMALWVLQERVRWRASSWSGGSGRGSARPSAGSGSRRPLTRCPERQSRPRWRPGAAPRGRATCFSMPVSTLGSPRVAMSPRLSTKSND